MAQAAVKSVVSRGALIGRPAEVPRMKRKTLSELRGEQLKRRTSENIANDQLFASAAFDKSTNGPRNTEQPKKSKYINTRVEEVFQVKKSRNIGKEIARRRRLSLSSPKWSRSQRCDAHLCYEQSKR